MIATATWLFALAYEEAHSDDEVDLGSPPAVLFTWIMLMVFDYACFTAL